MQSHGGDDDDDDDNEYNDDDKDDDDDVNSSHLIDYSLLAAQSLRVEVKKSHHLKKNNIGSDCF